MKIKKLALTFIATAFLSTNTQAIWWLNPNSISKTALATLAAIGTVDANWNTITFNLHGVPGDYVDKVVTTYSKCMDPPLSGKFSNKNNHAEAKVSGFASGKGFKCAFGNSENAFDVIDKWGNVKLSGKMVDAPGAIDFGSLGQVTEFYNERELDCDISRNLQKNADIKIECWPKKNKK